MSTPPNGQWIMDFVADRLARGRRYRILTGVHKCLCLETTLVPCGERVNGLLW